MLGARSTDEFADIRHFLPSIDGFKRSEVKSQTVDRIFTLRLVTSAAAGDTGGHGELMSFITFQVGRN